MGTNNKRRIVKQQTHTNEDPTKKKAVNLGVIVTMIAAAAIGGVFLTMNDSGSDSPGDHARDRG